MSNRNKFRGLLGYSAFILLLLVLFSAEACMEVRLESQVIPQERQFQVPWVGYPGGWGDR